MEYWMSFEPGTGSHRRKGVVLLPGSPVSRRLDFLGSLLVALYLLRCGLQTVREADNAAP